MHDCIHIHNSWSSFPPRARPWLLFSHVSYRYESDSIDVDVLRYFMTIMSLSNTIETFCRNQLIKLIKKSGHLCALSATICHLIKTDSDR